MKRRRCELNMLGERAFESFVKFEKVGIDASPYIQAHASRRMFDRSFAHTPYNAMPCLLSTS